MSKELIERARLFGRISDLATNELCQRLADRIEELERERDSAYKIADHYRAEHDALQADNARLREALEAICNPIAHMKAKLPKGARLNGAMAVQLAESPSYLRELAKAELAATPEQPLARLRNQVREECETLSRQMFNHAATGDEIADAILALKEPE